MTDRFARPLTIDGTTPTGRLSCASVIDAALETTDAASFFAAFGTNRFWAGPWGSKLEVMSQDARMLRMTEWLLYTRKDPRSLARHRWFAAYGVEYQRWLREIGAGESGRYVRELLDLYPGGVPFDVEVERDRLMTAAEKANPELWTELRRRYSSLEEELAACWRRLLLERGVTIGAECDALRARFAEPLPPTLSAIAGASSTDAEFSAALIHWLAAPKGPPKIGFDKQPEVGRMLWVLDALHTSVFVDGMTHFLYSNGVGTFFSSLATWAETIGAPTTAAYAKSASEVLRTLNGGQLPSMVDGPRIEAIKAFEEHDEAAGGRGLFDALDQEYRVLVTAELSQRLRAYVREHVEDIEHELFAAVEAHRAKS